MTSQSLGDTDPVPTASLQRTLGFGVCLSKRMNFNQGERLVDTRGGAWSGSVMLRAPYLSHQVLSVLPPSPRRARRGGRLSWAKCRLAVSAERLTAGTVLSGAFLHKGCSAVLPVMAGGQCEEGYWNVPSSSLGILNFNEKNILSLKCRCRIFLKNKLLFNFPLICFFHLGCKVLQNFPQTL